jgi:hypothetical protein
LNPDSPSDLRPKSPYPPSSPCFGAEAPRLGRSFGQRPKSVESVGGVVLLGAKTRWFRRRRLRAQSGPLHQAPERLEKASFKRCRSAGAWGKPISAAPERLGSQSRRGHLPIGSARRNQPQSRKNPAL